MNIRLAVAAALIFAMPLAANAQKASPVAQTNASAETSDTLFPGTLDLPIDGGAQVPSDCAYPASLTQATHFELACVVESDEDFSMSMIGWLGAHGWRRGADVIGGFEAVRETSNGCEQTLNIYPHGEEDGDDTTPGIWFALAREPVCPTVSPTAQ